MSTLYILVTLVAVLTFSTLAFAHITINVENLKHMRNMAGSMDHTADPCNNFFQYACGNRVQVVDNVGVSQVAYTFNIANTLNKFYPITRKVNQHYTEKLNIYYQACQNVRNASVLSFLNEVKPGPTQEWPFLEELQAYAGQDKTHNFQPRNTTDIDLIGLLAQLLSYGLNNVLVTHKMIRLQNGKLVLLVEVPQPTPVAVNELVTIMSSFKLPRSVVEKYMKEFVETHQYWQSVYKAYSKRRLYATPTYAALNAANANLSHLTKFLKQMYPHPAKIEDETIHFHLSYLLYLLDKEWQPNEARKFCNYLMFQFLIYLSETVKFGYYMVSSETKLALGLNYVYYKHFYLPHKKVKDELFASTVKTLYKHFAETVAENRLELSDQQLQDITTKLGKLRTNIGNLPENVTESMVEEYYSALPDLDINNFHKTELSVRRFAHLETLMCPKDMMCNADSPHAFYSPVRNIVYFPFPALAPPMYDWSWHPLFTMSILGSSAGHEVIHAIDSGVLNDEHHTPSFGGNSLQVASINATITCLSAQNSTDTINERLADVIGAQLAFRTYSREFGLQPEFTRTPWQQLFFLSLAQIFCGTGNDEDTVHDREYIRLQEIVMNSKEFAEAFECPAGSKMNPIKKCRYI